MFMSSSSSRECLEAYCTGSACVHFSSWDFCGVSSVNTDGYRLYGLFEYLIPNQQEVKLYKSTSYAVADLVAIGQGFSGVINLEERNDSGLTGTVAWDGVPVTYPNPVVLDFIS